MNLFHTAVFIAEIAWLKQPRVDTSHHGGSVPMHVGDNTKFILRHRIPLSNLTLLCIEVQPPQKQLFSAYCLVQSPK